MEVKDSRRGGSSSHPFLPFGLFMEQSVARSNSNSSYVCLINLKLMTTDTHDPYNCRMLFLSRLVLGVSRLSFNSWDIHLVGTEELRDTGISVLFHIYYQGGEWQGKVMQCVCMYVCMYVHIIYPIQSKQ